MQRYIFVILKLYKCIIEVNEVWDKGQAQMMSNVTFESFYKWGKSQLRDTIKGLSHYNPSFKTWMIVFLLYLFSSAIAGCGAISPFYEWRQWCVQTNGGVPRTCGRWGCPVDICSNDNRLPTSASYSPSVPWTLNQTITPAYVRQIPSQDLNMKLLWLSIKHTKSKAVQRGKCQCRKIQKSEMWLLAWNFCHHLLIYMLCQTCTTYAKHKRRAFDFEMMTEFSFLGELSL